MHPATPLGRHPGGYMHPDIPLGRHPGGYIPYSTLREAPWWVYTLLLHTHTGRLAWGHTPLHTHREASLGGIHTVIHTGRLAWVAYTAMYTQGG